MPQNTLKFQPEFDNYLCVVFEPFWSTFPQKQRSWAHRQNGTQKCPKFDPFSGQKWSFWTQNNAPLPNFDQDLAQMPSKNPTIFGPSPALTDLQKLHVVPALTVLKGPLWGPAEGRKIASRDFA